MKSNFTTAIAIVFLIVLFNNCGQGFKSLHFENSSSLGGSPQPSATPTATPTPAPTPTPTATTTPRPPTPTPTATATPRPGEPYALPGPGQAIAIGTNTSNDVRYPGSSSGTWGYAVFKCFGGGTFAPDYSARGAYVIAGSGGHGCPVVNIDATIFDFSTATWSRLPNANGVRTSDPNRYDYTTDETTGAPYYELLGATAGQIPAPGHLYQTISYQSPEMGGGAKGSYLRVTGTAITTLSHSTGAVHKFDLSTGLWTRMQNTAFSRTYPESVTVYDPVTKRYYYIRPDYHATGNLEYLDGNDWRVKSTPSYDWPPAYQGEWVTAFLEPVNRLLVLQSPGSLFALDLNNIPAGWNVLKTAGGFPAESNYWAHDPATGKFYSRMGDEGQVIRRLTVPENWKTGTWAFDQVTITGATLPTDGANSTRHYTRFFYVPAIQSFAWIASEDSKVIILRPP